MPKFVLLIIRLDTSKSFGMIDHMNEWMSDPMEQATLVSLCTFHEKDGRLEKSFYVNRERCPPLGRCSYGPGLVHRDHIWCTFAFQGTTCKHFLGCRETASDLRFSN